MLQTCYDFAMSSLHLVRGQWISAVAIVIVAAMGFGMLFQVTTAIASSANAGSPTAELADSPF